MAHNTTQKTEKGETRRDFIVLTAGAMAAMGGAAAIVPLVGSLNPSADVLALASTEIDISSIAEGQAITVMWRGKPVFIRHRTPKEIEEAKAVPMSELIDTDARNPNLKSTDSTEATDQNRAATGKEPWLVMVGTCTHLGCVPI